MKAYTIDADILITATGVVELIKRDMIKDGAVLIDVGTKKCVHVESGKSVCKIRGDVDHEDCAKIAFYITPVPGGVGPVTIAMLLKNLCTAYEIQSS